jgi:hypothetical protein
MKTALPLAAVLAAASFASAQAQDWSAAAAQDLQAIHDRLAADSPAPHVDKDSATFRSWLDRGFEQTRGQTGKANQPQSHLYALKAYTGGFRDASIDVIPNAAPTLPWTAAAWPGFGTAWRNNGYVVAWTLPNGRGLPPVGAQLLSCDKRPAEQIARERLDKYEADLELASGRVLSAPMLLWDRGNPFAGPLPQKCEFSVNGSRKSYTMNYQFGGQAEREQAYKAAAPYSDGKLALEQWGNGRYWISLHTSDDSNPGWPNLLAQVDAAQQALRDAPVVVIDLRGAGEGLGSSAYQVFNRLWGPEYRLSKAPQLSNVAYRVSPGNRQYFADAVARMMSDDRYFYEREKWQALVADLDKAAAANQPILQRNDSVKLPDTIPENPVKGRVIVVVDATCASGCLSMLDGLMALPNVTLAGTPTSADSIFVGREEVLLPSGQAKLVFGNKAWLDRPRGSNAPFTPAPNLTWTGAPNDDAGFKAWLDKAIGA